MKTQYYRDGTPCFTGIEPEMAGVTLVELTPRPALKDYLEAIALANRDARA